jgi:hypothetical protein
MAMIATLKSWMTVVVQDVLYGAKDSRKAQMI